MLCIKHSEVVRHRLTVKLSLPLLRRRRNFTHEVNFTIADNFTCPKGKLSFSVFSVKDNTLIGGLFAFLGNYSFFLYFPGEIPVSFLNRRQKYCKDENPLC